MRRSSTLAALARAATVAGASVGAIAGLVLATQILAQNPGIRGVADRVVVLLFGVVLYLVLGAILGLIAAVLLSLLPRRARAFCHRERGPFAVGAVVTLFILVDGLAGCDHCHHWYSSTFASLTVAPIESFIMMLMVIGRSILLGIPITLATVGVARWLRRGRTSRRRGLIAVIGGVACLAVAIVAVAASRPQVNPPRLEPSMSVESGVRVRLVVIDGVDWDIANPLISSGDMPNLASLMARGSWGELGIAFPCISPHMWTSLSTGFDDDVHGLCDFFSYRPPGTRALITRFPGGEDRLKRFVFRFLALRLGRWGVGSVVNPARSQKRVPELWDYLTQAGKTTCVAGWKYTYPPSAVNGVMVSDGFGKGYRGGSAVFPENLEEALDERCEQLSPNYMYRLLGRQPVPPPETLSRRARSKIDFIRDEIDRDVCFADLAAYVTDSLAPDFTAVGLYSVDKLEHRFMVERVLASWSDSPQLSGYFRRFTSEEELELFSPSISAAYAVSDSLLGTLIEGAGDDVVIVVSDHGHDQDGSGHRFGPKGVIVMAGGPVVQGARLDEAAVFDITPTVLHLMGLPVPAQMKGRVLTEVLEPSWMEANPVRELDYEGEPAVDTTAGEELEELSEEDIEQLKALGYVQ